MDESKETVSSTYNQDWCTYELRVYGSMHRASTGSNHTKSQHWKSKSAKVPHLTKMLYLQLTPAGEGKISFLRQSDNEYINYSSGKAQCPGTVSWPIQNKCWPFVDVCMGRGKIYIISLAFSFCLNGILFISAIFLRANEWAGDTVSKH